jgi:hypothetical protein
MGRHPEKFLTLEVTGKVQKDGKPSRYNLEVAVYPQSISPQ